LGINFKFFARSIHVFIDYSVNSITSLLTFPLTIT
jgi:hypothetical protein